MKRREMLKTGGASATGVALAGCIGGSGDGGNRVKIGILYPGTIPDGEFTRKGAMIAQQQRNDQGGLLGHNIEIVTGDTQLDAETAVSEARRLIDREGVDFLSGSFLGEAILAVQQQIAGSGPVYVSTASGPTQISQRVKENPEDLKYFFAVGPVTPQVVDSIAYNTENTVLSQTDFNSIVPVLEDVEWTRGYGDRLRETMSSNIDISDPIRYSVDTADFSPIFSDVRDSGAELMILGMGSGTDEVAFINQWAENQVPAALTGNLPAASNPNFPQQAGDSAVAVAHQKLGVAAPVSDVTLPFVNDYRDEFGEDPSLTAYYTYDAVRSIFAAVEAAGSLDDDAVVEELSALQMPGSLGTIQFQGVDDEFPHISVTDIDDGIFWTAMQWQRKDGDLKEVMLGPDEWADHDGEHEFVLPPWM